MTAPYFHERTQQASDYDELKRIYRARGAGWVTDALYDIAGELAEEAADIDVAEENRLNDPRHGLAAAINRERA